MSPITVRCKKVYDLLEVGRKKEGFARVTFDQNTPLTIRTREMFLIMEQSLYRMQIFNEKSNISDRERCLGDYSTRP